MSKLSVGLLVSVIVAGNIVTSTLLLGLRDSAPVQTSASGAADGAGRRADRIEERLAER